MDRNCTPGTEFLAAKAADAELFVYFRLIFDHLRGLRRADLGAFAAADAHGTVYPGPGAEAAPQEGAEPGALAREVYVPAARDMLEVGNEKALGLAVYLKLAPVGGAEAAFYALRDGLHVGALQIYEVRAEQVGAEGRVRRDERAHVPRRAVRGAVALHALDGVHKREARRVVEREVYKLGAEVLKALVEVVHFRLARAGDGAEEVFNGAGHVGHAVGLELGEVDYRVGPAQPGRVGEALYCPALGENGLHGREVLVELAAGFNNGLHAGAGVDRVYPGRREGAAGAVPDHDARAEAAEYARERGQALRVRHRGGFRRKALDEIGFYGDGHAGLHPAEAAHGVYRLPQRGLNALRGVVPAGDYADVCGQVWSSPFGKRYKY